MLKAKNIFANKSSSAKKRLSFLFCDKSKNKYKFALIFLFVIGVYVLSFHYWEPLFAAPTSTVIEDSQGNLLTAQIASDEQWRFPLADSVPYKFEQAILNFEDQYFYKHPGINVFAIARALKQNIKAHRIVSGGSTITSQTIRLSRQGRKRSVYEKIIENILALKLELNHTKKEILILYSSHAPFGGNVVGLNTAAWRYYGRSANQLSWGESATLAVLPNAPSLIYPGRNQQKLLAKRNRLLDKLLAKNIIDSTTAELAKFEPLPGKPKRLPQLTPHLLNRVRAEHMDGQRIATTINKELQIRAAQIVNKHHQVLQENQINNAAAIIINVQTNEIVAYIGNTNSAKMEVGQAVDIIAANRSTGSTLKPFLFAMMQDAGLILPTTLIPDIPTHIAGYAPKNFDKKFNGAVHANNALARSLNIPAVRMLRSYGVEHFHVKLPLLGLSTMSNSANHYGLSLILGGAETSLFELSSAYAGMARTLNNFANNSGKYASNNFDTPSYLSNITTKEPKMKDSQCVNAGAIWLTFESLTDMNRPIEGEDWKLFKSSKKIAWKTGTSYGFRDAWAVGTTPEYVVGVWVGNANGEGRPGLTGTLSAAPIMFDLFKMLPRTTWFNAPYDDLVQVSICKQSGHKASSVCNDIDTVWVCDNGLKSEICPYHKLVHLDAEQEFQVNSDCYSVSKIVTKPWFILPPVMEWYYKSTNPYYMALPPMHPDCNQSELLSMDLLYPRKNTKIYLPRGLNMQKQKSVFEATHRNTNIKVNWHLNNEYVGTSIGIHKMDIFIGSGQHTLTLVDETGETLTRYFEVLSN